MPTRSDLRVELKRRIGFVVRRLGDDSIQPHETSDNDQYLDSVLERAALWVQAQMPLSLHFESTALLTVAADGTAPVPKRLEVLHEAYNWDGSKPTTLIKRLDPFEFRQRQLEGITAQEYLYWSVFDGKIRLLPAQTGTVQIVGYRQSLLTPTSSEAGVQYQDTTDGSMYVTDDHIIELLTLRAVAEWLMDIAAFELANSYIQRSQELVRLVNRTPKIGQKPKRRAPRWL